MRLVMEPAIVHKDNQAQKPRKKNLKNEKKQKKRTNWSEFVQFVSKETRGFAQKEGRRKNVKTHQDLPAAWAARFVYFVSTR